jgi:hypothetical protein
MADVHDSPDSRPPDGGDTESIAGMPRWVKLFGLAAVVALVLIIGIHLAGGGLGGHMHAP